LRGCDPKRVLISGAEAIDAEVHMRGHGVKGEARIDWRDLMTFKRSFTDMCRVTSKGILPKMALTPFTELPASLVEMSLSLRARSLWLDTFWSLLVRARYRWIFPAKSMLSPANNFLSLIAYPRASFSLAVATSPPNFRTSRLGPAFMSRCSSAPSRCSRHLIEIWWVGSWRSSMNSASTCARGRLYNESIRPLTASLFVRP